MTVSEKEMLFQVNVTVPTTAKADGHACDSDWGEENIPTFRTRPQRRLCHLDLRACALS